MTIRVAGIMSGTSLDGVDVAVIDIDRRRFRTVAFHSFPYGDAIRASILAVSNAATTTAAISRLNFQLGELYAKCVRQACRRSRIAIDSIQLIGCHGQTIYHEGSGKINTLQIGEAAVIAARTGIPVVSDFRSADIAAGGKGAPLVPFVDYLLFRDAKRNRVALNIGGIANITILPAGAKQSEVAAFDTGPGNMVIDALTTEYTGGRERYDRDGAIAKRSRADRGLLNALLRDPYYRAKPPKTAGREQYGAEFVARLRDSGASLPNLIATATLLTAVTIAQAVPRNTDDLIVSGGGARNPQIVGHLAALLPGAAIADSAAYGIDPDGKEAVAFALLAHETWHKRPGNLPSATGAKRPAVLGKVSMLCG